MTEDYGGVALLESSILVFNSSRGGSAGAIEVAIQFTNRHF